MRIERYIRIGNVSDKKVWYSHLLFNRIMFAIGTNSFKFLKLY